MPGSCFLALRGDAKEEQAWGRMAFGRVAQYTGLLAEWHEGRKSHKGGYRTFRYLQSNNFVISTLFRA